MILRHTVSDEALVSPHVSGIGRRALVAQRTQGVDDDDPRLALDVGQKPDLAQLGAVRGVIVAGISGVHDVVLEDGADAGESVGL
jgi:hypothetical protein